MKRNLGATRSRPALASTPRRRGSARGFGSDARAEEQVADLFARVESEVGPLAVTVFNAGGNVRFEMTKTTARVYRKVWEMGGCAGFFAGRESARVMCPRGRGTIRFTGATASGRGTSGFSAFAGTKFGLRTLAQSMPRELGPEGIHVAHIVVDGAIDTRWIRESFPDRYARKEREGILDPAAVAENYWRVHVQPRNAWTHALDLRPWIEPF